MKVAFVVVVIIITGSQTLDLPDFVFLSQGSILSAEHPNKAVSAAAAFGHADHKYVMSLSFTTWEQRRRDISPEADRILPLVKGAGVFGMSRKQLGSAVKLDRDVLDDLLGAMVGTGILILSRDAQGPVYRATAM